MPLLDCYAVLGYEFILQCATPDLAEPFRHVLSGFHSPASSPCVSPYKIDISSGDRPYRISRDDTLLGEYATLWELVSQVEWSILGKAFSDMPYLGLHAGAVSRDGHVLLIPGNSGSGKSSLVLGLLLRGWSLLSDEAALIDPDAANVLPFPRTICMKDGSLENFRALDRGGLLDQPGAAIDIGGVLCVAPGVFSVASHDRTFTVDSVVFPRFREGGASSIEKVSRARGLSLLMSCAINRRRFRHRIMGILAKLVENGRCYQLRSGSLISSLDLLAEVA